MDGMHRELERLKIWFQREKRDFLWRKDSSPYAVWISEVMLQQTQASVVTAYFERWMERFPSISALAAAGEEEVMKAWEGLGYYSRARHLHAGAKWLSAHHKGELPDSEEELCRVKGLGPYTVAAILSFAFHRKAAALDGNVARVMARLNLIEEDICKSGVQKRLRKLTLDLLPDQEPWVVMEALIELGATICTKSPQCWKCPMKRSCLAFKEKRTQDLPLRESKMRCEILHRNVAVIEHEGKVLLQLHGPGKLMAGLYEFPYFVQKQKSASSEVLQGEIFQALSLCVCFKKSLLEVKHTFTKYRCHLYPVLWQARELKQVEGYRWVSREAMRRLAFSSGHRRILQQLEDP